MTSTSTTNIDYGSPAEKQHIETVLSLYGEVFNERTPKAVESYLSDDFIQHNTLYGEGAEGHQKFVSEFFLANFPDLNVNTEVAIGQNSRVYTFTTWTGTHKDTGQEMRVLASEIYRFWDGKIAEHWDVLEYSELQAFGLARPKRWHQPSAPFDRGGTPEQQANLKRLLSYLEEVPIQDLSLAGKFITEDFKQFEPWVIEEGLEGFLQCFAGFRPLAPDLAVAPDNIVAGNKYVGSIWNSYGHQPETGKKFIMPTADAYLVEDGMFAKHWGLVDYTDIMNLLGFNPKQHLKDKYTANQQEQARLAAE
jgi:predicted SnoaL-like aldol condensation-catalyzing enzyme